MCFPVVSFTTVLLPPLFIPAAMQLKLPVRKLNDLLTESDDSIALMTYLKVMFPQVCAFCIACGLVTIWVLQVSGSQLTTHKTVTPDRRQPTRNLCAFHTIWSIRPGVWGEGVV